MAPLVDPATDLEDERPTPVGSPLAAVDEYMPLSPTSDVDVEVACALLEVGVLPALVTPIVDPAVGFPMTPVTYPVPPVPMMSFGDSVPLEVAPPAGLAVGSPARSEIPLCQVSSPASVTSPGLLPSSPVLRPAPDVSLPSGLAAMDQELPWSASLPLGFSVDSTLLPAPLTSSPMVEGVVVPGLVVSSIVCGEFDVHQDRPVSGAFPRVLDAMGGFQYRMTSYHQDSGGPDFSPAYGIQLHDPRLLEYVGAPESARLLSCSPEYWLHHLGNFNTTRASSCPMCRFFSSL